MGDVRVLDVEYGTARAFAHDYRANLANGGVFVATQLHFDLREFVIIRLRLPWCSRVIDLEGEVVHIVPAEMAGVGGKPGVAVQFREPPSGIRGRLAPLCVDAPQPGSEAPQADEERRAPRKLVRVEARIEGARGAVRGRTRNLSRSGVLVDIQEGTAASGDRVRVMLSDPRTREELAIDGTVVRTSASGSTVSALAVKFDPDAARGAGVERFVDGLQQSEHTRRLGGISGPIAELGPQSIIQMFATSARRGTIFMRHGEEEGLVCFDGGLLRVARIGPVTGMKALIRILCWREGTFEFQSGLEEPSSGDAPLPLEAALFDAMRKIDEAQRQDPSGFPLQARLVAKHAREGQFSGVLGKLEEALLDLAQAGFTVQRALEVIPEPDAEIFRALRSLVDNEMLELH